MRRVQRIAVDWERLALNLRSEMTLADASRRIGKHDGFVAQLSRRSVKEPSFSDGLALLTLHLEACGEVKHRGLLIRG